MFVTIESHSNWERVWMDKENILPCNWLCETEIKDFPYIHTFHFYRKSCQSFIDGNASAYTKQGLKFYPINGTLCIDLHFSENDASAIRPTSQANFFQ